MQELEKILEEIEAEHPYKVPGNYDSYSQYNEAWQDAIDRVRVKLEEFFKEKENDGWIPVEERLPEEKKSVLVQWEKYDRYLNVTLTYLDVMWLEDEEDVVFETINGIPNGRVIAWRPLPEPYRPERCGRE